MCGVFDGIEWEKRRKMGEKWFSEMSLSYDMIWSVNSPMSEIRSQEMHTLHIFLDVQRI